MDNIIKLENFKKNKTDNKDFEEFYSKKDMKYFCDDLKLNKYINNVIYNILINTRLLIKNETANILIFENYFLNKNILEKEKANLKMLLIERCLYKINDIQFIDKSKEFKINTT